MVGSYYSEPSKKLRLHLNDTFLIIFWYTISVCDTFNLMQLPEIQHNATTQ